MIVLSNDFWRSAFNADRGVLGRTVRIHGKAFTIVGVAAPDFAGLDLDRADLWAPLNTTEPNSSVPGLWYEGIGGSYRVVARLHSEGEERHVLDVGTAAIRSVHIRYFEYDSTARVLAGPIVQALGPAQRAQEVSLATRVGGVAVFVLLIATANVVNLLLLRAARRKREIALRRALGVSQGRLLRQLAVESAVLVLIGGGTAAVLSIWVGAALRRLVLPRVHWASGALDTRTAMFVALASVAIGMIAGLAPAAQAMNLDLARSLKAGGRDATYQRSRLRSGLVALQAALCTILLVGTGLFVNSLRNMESIGTGYAEMDHVLVARPMFDDAEHHTDQVTAALPLAVDRLNRIGGVTAAYTSVVPLGGNAYGQLFMPGRPDLPKFAADPYPTIAGVSADYFRATGIGIKRGRAFSPSDVSASANVVIVSETMARAYWPNEDAIGKCLIVGKRENPCSTVVGVVADAHRMDIIEHPVLQYYVPSAKENWPGTALVMRVAGSRIVSVRHDVDQILRQLLPAMAWTNTRTLTDILEPELRPWRLGATLFASLAVLAIAVAGVGIYSVTAYGVSQRTHEMGIRIALGARTSDILDLVLGDGLRVVVAGVGAGVLLSLFLGRLVQSLLFGITSSDPSVLIATVVVLLAISGVATIIPGWRATRVDPVTALRAD